MAANIEGKVREADPEKRRPAFEARYGRVRVSVWRQESDKGPWFNVSLSRIYKDESGAWQYSNSFGVRDLLEVAKLCNEAHSYIHRELAKEHTENAQGSNPGPNGENTPF